MVRLRRRRCDAPTALLFVVLSIGVGACGAASGPSASSAASPTPAVTASPSPDPVAGFMARAVEVLASGTARVDGTLTAATTEGVVEGEFAFDGRDSRSRLAVTLGEALTETERIERLGHAWERTAPGPWLVDEEPPDDGRTFADTLQEIRSVEELGVETRDGRTLHRLRPELGRALVPVALGLDDPAIRDPELTPQFLVAVDGTPAVMLLEASWTQVLAGADTPVSLSLEFAFDDWGAGATIRPPDDVWVTYRSDELGYSMAHPDDWTVTRSNDQDVFGRDGAGFVYVAPQDLPTALTTEQFREAVVEASKDELGGAPVSIEPATLGGQAAHRVTYRTEDASGAKIVLVDYLTVRGLVGWEVYLIALAGETEARDLAFFEAFIASFAFAD